jgi:hypothetical protein
VLLLTSYIPSFHPSVFFPLLPAGARLPFYETQTPAVSPGFSFRFLLASLNPFWQYRILVTDDQKDDDNAGNDDDSQKV